jgi:hypothetical protein
MVLLGDDLSLFQLIAVSVDTVQYILFYAKPPGRTEFFRIFYLQLYYLASLFK